MVFVLIFGAVTTAVRAEDPWAEWFEGSPTDYIKSRTYIGFLGTSSTIDQWGDFNGINWLQSVPSTVSGSVTTFYPEQDLIPSINRKYGWGALVGHREGPWALEISYWRSDHTGTFTNGVTVSNPASYQSLNFDFKRYLFTQLPTQPFIQLGLSLPWLWFRQGSYQVDTSTTPPTVFNVNDETISGVGFNLGAGLEIYIGNNFSIMGAACQRWTGFNQVNGASKVANNNLYFDGNSSDVGTYEGDGLNFYVGTTFGFQ